MNIISFHTSILCPHHIFHSSFPPFCFVFSLHVTLFLSALSAILFCVLLTSSTFYFRPFCHFVLCPPYIFYLFFPLFPPFYFVSSFYSFYVSPFPFRPFRHLFPPYIFNIFSPHFLPFCFVSSLYIFHLPPFLSAFCFVSSLHLQPFISALSAMLLCVFFTSFTFSSRPRYFFHNTR